jgi:hypothetical protein
LTIGSRSAMRSRQLAMSASALSSPRSMSRAACFAFKRKASRIGAV